MVWLSLLCILPSLSQSTQPAWPPKMPVPRCGRSLGRMNSTLVTPPPPCGSSPTCPAVPSVGATQRPTLPRPRSPLGELSHLPCSPTAAHPPALLLPTGRSRGAIISQYYNRTARLRRRSSRPPLQQLCHTARPSLRQYDLESDPARATLEGEGPPGVGAGSAGHCPHAGFRMGTLCPGWPCPTEPLVPPDKWSLLVKELLSLSPSQRSHMLLNVPLSLAEKRTLR